MRRNGFGQTKLEDILKSTHPLWDVTTISFVTSTPLILKSTHPLWDVTANNNYMFILLYPFFSQMVIYSIYTLFQELFWCESSGFFCVLMFRTKLL